VIKLGTDSISLALGLFDYMDFRLTWGMRVPNEDGGALRPHLRLGNLCV